MKLSIPWRKSETPQDDPTPTTPLTEMIQDSTAPDPPGYDWKMKALGDSLTTTGKETLMWFIMRNESIDYASVSYGEAMILKHSRAFVALVGRTIHTRVTYKPYPASLWAANLDHDVPDPVNPEAWKATLDRKQQRLRYGMQGEPVVYVGIPVGGTNFLTKVIAKARRYDENQILADDAVRLQDEMNSLIAMLDDVARPATQREVERMVHRSRGLCLPDPLPTPTAGDLPMDVYDLVEIFDEVTVQPPMPGARTVTLTGSMERNGAVVERAVTVLSVGRMDRTDLRVPEEHHPWLGFMHQFSQPVEMSIRTEIVSGEDAAKDLSRQIRLVLEQIPQFVAHGEQVPMDLQEVEALAPAVKHQMANAHPLEAVRCYSYIDLAVCGTNTATGKDKDGKDLPSNAHKNADKAANALKKHADQYRIPLHRPAGQAALIRGFVPHESRGTTAHRRRMPVMTFAGAMPGLTSTVGDKKGMHWGSTIGATGGPFFWHLHRGMEALDNPGLTPVVAQKGGGKSNVIGFICALMALMRVHTTVLDPSGPLARLCEWGPIKAFSDHIDLLNARGGTLSPYSVIPDPSREAIAASKEIRAIPDPAERETRIQDEFNLAVVRAGMDREALALDTLRQTLPADYTKRSGVEATLTRAIRAAGSPITGSLNAVMDHLKADDTPMAPLALEMWEDLDNIRRHPRAALFFQSGTLGGFRDPRKGGRIPTLLVITMPGLQMPEVGTDKARMNLDERLAIPLLNLAAHYATTRIYSRPMHERKVVALDEAHWLTQWPSGRTLMSRLQRDDRKWNVRTFVASQDVATATQATAESKALVSDTIIGFLEDDNQRLAACDLLHIGRDMAGIFGELKSSDQEETGKKWRHFMVRINGEVGRVSWEMGDFPELMALLDTSPRQETRERDLIAAGRVDW